jgi:hypothetical protein
MSKVRVSKRLLIGAAMAAGIPAALAWATPGTSTSTLLGLVTFDESDDPRCEPVVRTAGQGFLDVGDHAHIARNETSAPAVNVVTYLAPPGATLRIDRPAPGNCPF